MKIRKLGDVTSNLEPLLLEMYEKHGLQFHEVLGIIYLYTQVHYPEAFETYEDGTKPILTYGPKT